MKTAITIAGSDSSGGAGIQADIKTMITNGVYAMRAITALTAQNTTGVTSILNATPEFLGQELDSIFTDIYPDAVKIGMVSDKELIKVIAAKLRQYEAKNIVVDPVMVATSGAKLISDEGRIIPACKCTDSEYSGGRGVDRKKDHKCRRDDRCGERNFRKISLCSTLQGWTQLE